MNRLNWLFNEQRTLRAGWRFVLFLAIYILSGKILDWILTKIHFPERAFTWSSLLLNYLVDFAFVAAIAWVMSRIGRERFSSYGLPLASNAGALLMKGVVWGFIPSALILVPIYFCGRMRVPRPYAPWPRIGILRVRVGNGDARTRLRGRISVFAGTPLKRWPKASDFGRQQFSFPRFSDSCISSSSLTRTGSIH